MEHNRSSPPYLVRYGVSVPCFEGSEEEEEEEVLQVRWMGQWGDVFIKRWLLGR